MACGYNFGSFGLSHTLAVVVVVVVVSLCSLSSNGCLVSFVILIPFFLPCMQLGLAPSGPDGRFQAGSYHAPTPLAESAGLRAARAQGPEGHPGTTITAS